MHICGVAFILRHCDVNIIGTRRRAKGTRKETSVPSARALVFPCALCHEPLTSIFLHLHIFRQPPEFKYAEKLLELGRRLTNRAVRPALTAACLVGDAVVSHAIYRHVIRLYDTAA